MAFSWYKLLTGKDSPEDPTPASQDWFKALGLGIRLFGWILLAVLLIAGALFIWRIFFPAPQGNTNSQKCVILPGGKIEGGIDISNKQTLVLPQRRFHVGGFLSGGTGRGTNTLYSGDSGRTSITAGIFGWVDLGK